MNSHCPQKPDMSKAEENLDAMRGYKSLVDYLTTNAKGLWTALNTVFAI